MAISNERRNRARERTRSLVARLGALTASVALIACVDSEERAALASIAARTAAPVEGVATGIAPAGSGARFVHALGPFDGPESVRYDPGQDVYFVSNIAGYGSFRDNNGYISRLSAEDPTSASVFVAGGANGVTLNAPKGMAIQGDTLWVTDIDVLRGFDRRTGAPVATIDFAPLGAVQLNDIALGPDGRLRITDTGILMIPAGVKHTGPDRVFIVGPNHSITEVTGSAPVGLPNGIAWDAAGKRWIVVSFDPFVGEVVAMAEGDSARSVIWSGAPRLDGVEALPDGSLLFTSWGDSSLHLVSPKGDKQQLVREIPEPADIGIDTRRHRVAIPLSVLGQVQLWSIGEQGRIATQAKAGSPP